MQTLATTLLVATLALGILVGFYYLARARRRHLVSLHLILGSLATWLVLVLMQARPPVPGSAAVWAGILLGAAVLGGLLPRLLAPRIRKAAEWVLVAHVFTGVAAFLVFLSWASRL